MSARQHCPNGRKMTDLIARETPGEPYKCALCPWWHVRPLPPKSLSWTPLARLKEIYFELGKGLPPKWTAAQQASPFIVRKLGKSNLNGPGKFGGRVVRSFETAEDGLKFLAALKDPGEYELRQKLTRWREETISSLRV